MDTPVSPVTVVVPTANRRETLRMTLGSILAQRGVDLRVVVVDDAGDPGTRAWLEGLGDERVTTRSHDEPQGAAAARNTGLAAVGTEWVAFCDDDDLWSPTKLATQLAAVEREHAVWSCTGAVCVDEAMRIIDHQRLTASGDVLAPIIEANLVPGGGSSVLARTDVVREVGAFDTTITASEDWDLWIRLAQRGPVAAVDAPHVAYRIWPGSKSRDTRRVVAAFETIERRYANPGARPDWRRHRRWVAKQQLRSGNRVGAAATFAQLARSGRPALWSRSLAALVAPRTTDRVGTARAARQVPAAWRTAAEGWLPKVRAADELPPVRLAPIAG